MMRRGAVLALLLAGPLPAGELAFRDCRAEWTADTLTVRNHRIERQWRIVNGLLVNRSLRDVLRAREYLQGESPQPSPSPEFAPAKAPRAVAVRAGRARAVVVEEESLQAGIRADFDGYTLTTRVRIYPDTPAVSTWIEMEGAPPPAAEQRPREVSTGVENVRPALDATRDLNEFFRLDRVHKTLYAVDLMDDTDVHDNLVQVTRWVTTLADMREAMRGNLFVLEDQFRKDGVVFLKEAPLPHARPVKSAYDLAYQNEGIVVKGLGAGADPQRSSYPLTTILYSGGAAGRTAALQIYQRRRRVYDPARDEKIWHSTWGDRNRDGRVSEAFLSKEMDRGIPAGIDHLYFTDGWQKGPSRNSVVAGGLWENQWSRPDYWDVNPTRFPRGLEPLVERARAHGMHVGMWHNVDKVDDYANWERDVARILDNWRRYGITNVKFDAVTFRTKKGELNLLAAMRRVVEETGGRLSVEIDITAGIRHGYFGAMPYGFLFLENRYTDLRRYYPHLTLRNLWQLAHWVDPARLRMEFLNNERNRDKYGDDPLAPYRYRFDYVFAVTMFANPMAWLEFSGLSEEQMHTLRKIVPLYKRHREAIRRGLVYPLGGEPSGQSWTGFQSCLPGESKGYVLVFRELHPDAARRLKLADLEPGTYRFEPVFGDGAAFEARPGPAGEIEFTLPRQLSYGFYRYEKH